MGEPQYYVDPSTGETRQRKSKTKKELVEIAVRRVEELKERGYSNVAIAQQLGVSESSVRFMLKTAERKKES